MPGPAWALLFVLVFLFSPRPVLAQGELVQVHEDFSADPGWEGINNHVVARDGPIVTQDFGYRRGSPAGSSAGEVGGVAWSSTTGACYGMKVGPFGYANALSASGRIAIRRAPGRSGLYVGFYNSTRQGWRPWSSLMIQLTGSQRGGSVHERGVRGAQVWFTTVSAGWRSSGMVTDIVIPADGSAHTWSFRYDPDARIDLTWPHPDMEHYFRDNRMSEDALYEKAKSFDPNLSRAGLRSRLEAATAQGLLVYDPRRGTDYWERQRKAEQFRGSVTLQIDNDTPRRMYLEPGHREEPLVLDRFGVVNQQTYGTDLEFSLFDLTVNGHKIDLSSDPGWEGRGNRVSFREQDFHSRQDFGFRETNWAGDAPGEIGGTFWRTEPVDPLHGFYAADVGTLTLDDPIAFSGHIAFVEGQPDSGVCFGYFNRHEALAEITDESAGHPKNQAMGIVVEGPTRVGYYFSGLCAPTRSTASRREGPVFLPTREKHSFTFAYDPSANDGVGRITIVLEKEAFHLDLKPAQRSAGAKFNRFGLWNMRSGGKFVEVYLDDLTFTSRRPRGETPAGRAGKPIEVPYPEGGRRY